MKNELATAEPRLFVYNSITKIPNPAGYDEDTQGTNIQFPRIPMASSGALTFTIEEDGKDKPTEFLTGVIICNYPINQYYIGKMDPENPQPPVCYSNDGLMGISKEGISTVCAKCSKNAFIDNKKECKNQRKIFILPEGSLLPYLLTIPPTSLKPWGEYIFALKAKRLNSKQVVTKIGLRLVNTGGQKYSVCTFAIDSVLTAEKQTEIIDLYDALSPLMKRQVEFNDTKPETEEDFIPPMEEEFSEVTEIPATNNGKPPRLVREANTDEILDILSDVDPNAKVASQFDAGHWENPQLNKKQPSEDGDTELQEKDRKLAQMILAKTGYDSKNETKRHQLCDFLTGISQTSKWQWEEIKRFIAVSANYLGVEELPQLEAVHFATLKGKFDSIIAELGE
jgi:hypothetical protein